MSKFTLYLALAGLIALIVLLLTVPAFAVFGETLIFLATVLVVFWVFDQKVMHKIDTIEEIQRGNIAYAIFLLAIALLFLAVATIVG